MSGTSLKAGKSRNPSPLRDEWETLGSDYRLVRVGRREHAESLWRMALRHRLPVSVKEATQRRVRRAADLKSNHAIAYADAFAVATALEFDATLLTGDPEIKPLVGQYDLKVEWLQQKGRSQLTKGETH